jgi:hypothetical protein
VAAHERARNQRQPYGSVTVSSTGWQNTTAGDGPQARVRRLPQ